nr:alpha-amylase family glycosyl hydrolase [uncultured Desulfobacter sp.]
MPEYSSGHEALCKEFTRECVELAMLTTPAVRVEGELVGALRRELAPHLSADIEGALWFSGLVGAYGVNGLVLQTDVRRVLCESLTCDPRAEAAWQIIYECHKSISPALLSEEIIAWHGMNVAYLEHTLVAPAGNRQPEDTRQTLDDELHKVLATLKDKGRTKGLGQWARRAVPSFPKAAMTLTPTWAFNLALSSRGEKTVPIPGQPPLDLFERGYSGLFDGVRMRQLAVRRSGEELVLGPLSEIPGFCIQVPDTEPCMVRIEWSDSSGTGVETLQITGNQTRRISVGYGPVRIHTLDGAVYDPDSNADLDSTPPEEFFGAWPTNKGTYFRVWAPNADRVIVVTFPGESHEELRHLGDGTWQGFTADAKIGQEYKLLLATGKHEAWHVDPYARKLNNNQNGIICDRRPRVEDEFRLSPHEQLVLYELHIGSFNRRTPDAIGTFHTAAQRLSYLVDLGVNAVLLMPVHTRPSGDSWGFDPSHIFAVTEEFGGPEALRQFILKAHAHGIGVLLQLCLSHAGPETLLWNFDAQQDDEQDNGCYFFPSTDPRSKGPWGPTYNISREEVKRYLRDNVMMWFEEFPCCFTDRRCWKAAPLILQNGTSIGTRPTPVTCKPSATSSTSERTAMGRPVDYRATNTTRYTKTTMQKSLPTAEAIKSWLYSTLETFTTSPIGYLSRFMVIGSCSLVVTTRSTILNLKTGIPMLSKRTLIKLGRSQGKSIWRHIPELSMCSTRIRGRKMILSINNEELLNYGE